MFLFMEILSYFFSLKDFIGFTLIVYTPLTLHIIHHLIFVIGQVKTTHYLYS